jgi:DNA-binding transcriptional MerR regulator
MMWGSSSSWEAAARGKGPAAPPGPSTAPERERDRGLYAISVAAELVGVHPQTLRLYERRGLLRPRRTGGGGRRYSNDDLDRLRRIGRLADAGINLEGIKVALALEEEAARLRAELSRLRGGPTGPVAVAGGPVAEPRTRGAQTLTAAGRVGSRVRASSSSLSKGVDGP